MTRVYHHSTTVTDELIEAPGIKIIRGKGKGRYPYCNTLIAGTDSFIVVDPHSVRSVIEEIKARVNTVIFTHYHTDHVRYHELISAPKIAPVEDRKAFTSIDDLAEHTGIANTRYMAPWFERIRSRGWTMPEVSGFYRDGEKFTADGLEMITVHLPGHTRGHSGFYIPSIDLLFTGDIDFTSFGPWYGNACSDIDDFLKSLEKISEMKPSMVVTSHEKWVIFQDHLEGEIENYRRIIDRRDDKILDLIKTPANPDEVAGQFPIYGQAGKKGDFMIYFMEREMVKKHLDRLVRKGLAEKTEGGKYRAK